MSDPSPTSREKLPSRMTALFRRTWSGKDIAILALALSFVSMSAFAFRAPISAAFAKMRAGAQGGETVSVFDVVVDRQNRQYFDILFDKPLGQGKVGEVLDPAPASIFPILGGSWKWQDTNALRFEPSGGLPVASEFKVEIEPEKIIQEGQVFTGETEVVVKTDKFLVEDVTVFEEPALEGKAKVVFRGEMKFNYPVDPKTLAPLVKLVDPEQKEPTPVVLETDWNNNVIGYRTEPVQKQRDERKVRLTIAGTLTPSNGNAPLGEEYVKEIEVGSSTKLTIRGVETQPGPRESTIKVTFSSPISAAVAEKYVTLEPAVKMRFGADRNELTITGEMTPGESYTLTVGKGMPATDEAVLQEEYQEQVDLPDLEPSVGFQSQGMFLWSQGQHAVALEAVNAPKVRMTIDRVYLNNLFFLFQYGGFYDSETGYFDELNHALGDRLKEETLNVGGAKNKRRVYPVDLDKFVNTQEPGLYRVSVGQPDAYEASQRWLLLTDLGVVAKRGPGEILVWVSSLKDLSPVADAKVTLLSDQNQPMASGRTDGEGVWRVYDPKTLSKGTPYMVTIEKGDDFSFLLLDQMAIDPAGLDVGGAEAVGEGYTAFLYGERDLYRPGEKVEGLAIVRDGSLKIPPSMPALLRHKDPQGRELEVKRLTTGDKGLAPFDLDLPAYALTGNHTLELEVAEKVIGQYRFHVEEFVPDRISVAIVPPKENVGPGQKLAYQVQSDYLFGAPAANLPVETRVRLVDSTFAPKGFEGFSFRNEDRKLEDNEILSVDDGKLDEEGRASFEAEMPAGAPVPSSLEAVITARVQEQGGRGVAALERLQVHPYPYYIGLRRAGGNGQGNEGFADPGKPAGFEYVAVAPDGKEVASGGLRADLFEDRWNTVLRKGSGGSWQYETTRDPVLIASKTIGGGKSRGGFEMTPRSYGSYRMVLTDPETQASTAVEFYAAGWGTSPWAMKNPARLELDLDKAEYQPGETAVVQVRAPFSGKLLVTVERDRVLDTRVYDLTGNTAKIEVPIRAEYRPNAYVTATLVRKVGDLEVGSAGRAFGAVPLPVNRTANKLSPQITAPDQMRPGRDLAIAVKTVPNAVVTVSAVDEGILQLIAQKTPDPFEFFYRKLALGVTSYDTFSLLLPELKSLKAGGGEGELGMSQYARTEGIRRVEPVAFWSGPVTADAEGNAKVTFKVPEFQGALRIMAVSIDEDRFGSSQRLTRVRDPLVLLPTLPRILSFGETLQVPVTVRNDTGRPGTIQIGLTAQGPVRIEKAVQSVDIPAGREKTVYFTVKTGDASGNVRFVATAAGNGEKSSSTTNVGIRPDLPVIAEESAGAVGQAALEVPVKDADRFRPETLRRTVRIGPVPLVQFTGKLEHLLHYPYGCLEQTTSSAFPLIYIGDIAKALDPALLDPKKGHGDPAEMVQAGLRRIATMQLTGGGFTLWPGGQTVHPWGSVYATHFIVEARRAGHPVEESLHRGALGWLADEVKAKGTYGSEELQRMVYGLYVLARAGKPDLGTMDFIRQKHAKELSAESRALLAAAYASVGNPRATQSLAANIGQVEEIQRQTGGNFNSAIRNRALLLLALLDADPGSAQIPALVDRLARDAQVADSWWTTQEESFTLLALGQFLQRQAKQPPYSGTVLVGGKPVGRFTNATVTLPPITGAEPVRIQMDAGYKPGSAFYSVLTRGVPTDDAFKPASAGLEIQREFLNRDGGALDVSSVQQGDLVVIRTKVRSTSGPVANVAIVNLLPSGLEVENPRLQTTEQLPWVTDANLQPEYMDLRDDRILLFADLPADTWQTFYTLVRAVAPGQFRLPPVQVEAMYNPALRATGERGTMEVRTRQ